MAYIRKRKLPSGKVRFQTVWTDASGKRVSEMFDTSREANAKRIEVEGSRPTSSAPFRQLATDYLEYMQSLVDTGERERSYIDMLRSHINNHILSDAELADTRCSSLGTPEAQLFLNRLIGRVNAKSITKIRTTLSQICKHGARSGWLSSNPIRDTEVKVKRRPDAGKDASFELPSREQLKALIEGARSFDDTGRALAVVQILMFGGLRMSELRGLPREACHLKGDRPKLEIYQRADRYNVIGSVKSAASRREVDDAAAHEGPAIVDAHDDAAAVRAIGHAHLRAERQRAMRGGQPTRSGTFAVGCADAGVDRRYSGLSVCNGRERQQKGQAAERGAKAQLHFLIIS